MCFPTTSLSVYPNIKICFIHGIDEFITTTTDVFIHAKLMSLFIDVLNSKKLKKIHNSSRFQVQNNSALSEFVDFCLWWSVILCIY